MGELLTELRTELKDMRVDQEVLGSAAEVVPAIIMGTGQGAADEDVVDAAANLVGSAESAVAAATGGVVQVAKLEEGGEEPVAEGEVVPAEQKGGAQEESVKVVEKKPEGQGVYLFINPQIGGSDSRAGRPRGSGRRLQWEGMSGGGGEPSEAYSREAADEGGAKEIVVQKEG